MVGCDRVSCFIADTMDSVGILEMGGASTQIAFIPDTSVLADKFPLTIGGVRYPLYVHRSVWVIFLQKKAARLNFSGKWAGRSC